MPVPVAARFKAWVFGRSLAGIVGSNPAGGIKSVVSVICCQVEISATGRKLVQGSPTECVVSECGHKSSTIRRPWLYGSCCPMVKKNYTNICTNK